ncbi:hypothetical protein [Defluviitalea phaphyphila]|nr:hypothetical protein [Defluviitalea phaphyphila]
MSKKNKKKRNKNQNVEVANELTPNNNEGCKNNNRNENSCKNNKY